MDSYVDDVTVVDGDAERAASPIEPLKAVVEIGKPEAIPEAVIVDAMAWFLEDAPRDPSADHVTLNVNVADAGAPEAKWAQFTIRPLSDEEVQRAQRFARQRGNRAERRAGQQAAADQAPNVFEQSAYMVAQALVKPDLLEVARLKGMPVSADPTLMTVQVLKARFARRPGVIVNLAGRVMDISGYDESDVAYLAQTAATAGNS